MRANTVQSRPPENRMAIRTLCVLLNFGGTGTLSILSFRDSYRWFFSNVTDEDWTSRVCISEGTLLLREPRIDACVK